MLEIEYKSHLLGNFTATYKDYVIKNVYGDKKIFDEFFEKRKVQKAYVNLVNEYFNTIYNFYKQYPSGTFDQQTVYINNNAKLQEYVKQYSDISQGDSTLYGFLRVYGYCMEQVRNYALNEYDIIDNKGLKRAFDVANKTCGVMYDMVKLDIQANNLWWLKDTATTLRRQLGEKMIVINQARLQKMFDKFFPRKYDASKIADDDSIELMKELDFAMYEKYHTNPYYFWWGTNKDGTKKLLMAPQPPDNGAYTFVVYQNYTSDKVPKDQQTYYL